MGLVGLEEGGSGDSPPAGVLLVVASGAWNLWEAEALERVPWLSVSSRKQDVGVVPLGCSEEYLSSLFPEELHESCESWPLRGDEEMGLGGLSPAGSCLQDRVGD